MRFCSSFSLNGTRIFWGLMSSAFALQMGFGVRILGAKKEMEWIEGRTAMNSKILFLQVIYTKHKLLHFYTHRAQATSLSAFPSAAVEDFLQKRTTFQYSCSEENLFSTSSTIFSFIIFNSNGSLFLQR